MVSEDGLEQPGLRFLLEDRQVAATHTDFFQFFRMQGRRISSLADLAAMGVDEITQLKLQHIEFASVAEVMGFKDFLFSLFTQVSTVQELIIRAVTIKGKSCNLQLLQLFPRGIVTNLTSLRVEINPYPDLSAEKVEGTLGDFFANLSTVENLSIKLGGDPASSRAICKAIFTMYLPKAGITTLKTIEISADQS